MFLKDDSMFKLSESEHTVGDYQVDLSGYIPMSEAVKRLVGNAPLSDSQVASMYDFVDGVDNGDNVPFTRSSDYIDITDLSNNIRSETAEINGKIEEAKKNAEIEEKYRKIEEQYKKDKEE